MKKQMLIGAATIAVAFGSAVQAQNEPPRSSFADFDANGDGKLTQEEFVNVRGERYQQAYESGRSMRGVGHYVNTFKEMDANGDGFVSKKEFGTTRSDVAKSRREKREERRQQRNPQ